MTKIEYDQVSSGVPWPSDWIKELLELLTVLVFPCSGCHGEHQSGITKPPLAAQQQGIFAALPGVTDAQDNYARTLLA